MIVFLIILAVLVVLITAILCLSATVTLVYDKGWSTKVSVLFIEKDIELSKILSFLLFPEKKAKDVADENKKKKESQKAKKPEKVDNKKSEQKKEATEKSNQVAEKKPNAIAKLWDEEGIVGMLYMVSNLLETANSAILTLFRGLHIYSLYVMILVGGGDADVIARNYGRLCKYYYPLKGMILNGMKVDNYDDYIQPDFIADKTEFEMQFIASISVGLIVKMALKAVIVFLKNLIKDKNSK